MAKYLQETVWPVPIQDLRNFLTPVEAPVPGTLYYMHLPALKEMRLVAFVKKNASEGSVLVTDFRGDADIYCVEISDLWEVGDLSKQPCFTYREFFALYL